MRVALTGTTGYLGRFVVAALLGAGHTVVAQIRRQLDAADPLTQYGAQLEFVNGSMAEPDSLQTLVHQCDAVVHMAFMSATGRYRGGEGNDPAWFWEQNFGGTLRLLEACQGATVEKFVFLSSRAVFDGCHITGRLVDDEDTPVPNNHYGLLKRATEQLVQLHDDITFCSIRPTGIYGLVWPLTRTKWWNLLTDSRSVERALDSYSNRVFTEVHGADVASAILLVLQQQREHIHGHTLNCSDLLVSERYLVERYRRIQNSTVSDADNIPLEPPVNNMATAGLNRLGWRGGGKSKLDQFLRELNDASEQV